MALQYTLCIFTVFMMLTLSGVANAATIVVDTAVSGSLASQCTLQDAIESANQDISIGGCATGSGADILDLQDHRFELPISGYQLDNHPLALPTITSPISFITNEATIIAQPLDSRPYSLLGISSTGELTATQLTLDGAPAHALVLQGGKAIFEQTTLRNSQDSAVVLMDGANLELAYSVVEKNGDKASKLAGGVSINTGSYARIRHSRLSKNAGGLGCYQCEGKDSNTLVIEDSRINENEGTWIGGINTSNTLLMLTRSIVENNTSTLTTAGIKTATHQLSYIDHSTIDGNQSDYGPAGILASGNTRIIASTISNNVATRYGIGGLSLANGAWLYNSTVSGNRGIGQTGGVQAVSGTMIQSSTIAFNQLVSMTGSNSNNDNLAAGISGQPFMVNTLISNNIGGDDCANYLEVNQRSNFIADGSCGAHLSGNAQISPLTNNGGLTQTHAIATTSPLIDQGALLYCNPPQLLDLSTESVDQRGENRVYDGDYDGTDVCDIGAYERGITLQSNNQNDSTTVAVETDSDNRSSEETMAITDDTSPVESLDLFEAVTESGGGSLTFGWTLTLLLARRHRRYRFQTNA